jgi:hypothetical protein
VKRSDFDLAVDRPKVTDMMIQPIVSSMITAETMTCPTVRRRKPRSRTTIATNLTEEIDKAVLRNRVVMNRFCGSGSMESGRSSPNTRPHANGMAIPAIDTDNAARRERRKTDRSTERDTRDQLTHDGGLTKPLHQLAQ